MVGYGGSSAGSYLADPTFPIPSHCASIVATSTLRVNHRPVPVPCVLLPRDYYPNPDSSENHRLSSRWISVAILLFVNPRPVPVPVAGVEGSLTVTIA